MKTLGRIGIVAVALGAGGLGLLRWAAARQLEGVSSGNFGACQMVNVGHDVPHGLLNLTVVLDHVSLQCNGARGGDWAGWSSLTYASSRVELGVRVWSPRAVSIRLHGLTASSGQAADKHEVLRVEGAPIDLRLACCTAETGLVRFQSPFVSLKPLGISMVDAQGQFLWNTRASQQASAGGLLVYARQMGVPALGQGFERVRAAFSVPGPFSVLHTVSWGAMGLAGWPDVLVQRFSADWNGLEVGVSGHLNTGGEGAATGDFWLTLRQWKPFVEQLRQHGVLSAAQVEAMETTFDRLASREGMSQGALILPIMVRDSKMQVGTLPVTTLLPVLHAMMAVPAGGFH